MQKYAYVLLLLFCIILAGCNGSTENQNDYKKNANSKENKTVNNNIDIYDFYFINRAPDATEKHDLEEVIKFYFSTNAPIRSKIAINIENNEIYKKPRHSFNGIDTLEEPITFEDKESLLNILEKYSIQEWKEDYTTEDSDTYQDGYGWNLLLQFEDGTVERHRGQGSTVDIFPEGFEGFVREIDQLAKEILGEDYMKDSYNEP